MQQDQLPVPVPERHGLGFCDIDASGTCLSNGHIVRDSSTTRSELSQEAKGNVFDVPSSSTSITGLNNNEYQISRGIELKNLSGLSESCNFVKLISALSNPEPCYELLSNEQTSWITSLFLPPLPHEICHHRQPPICGVWFEVCMPTQSSPPSPEQRYNKLREKFPPITSFSGRPTLSEAGFDLLNRLLTYDPTKRITTKDALNHPWFREIPLPKSKEFMSTFPAQNAHDRYLEVSSIEI